MAEHYAGRVTAPAYILTQIFLSAPLQWLKARDRLRSLITENPELEQRLKVLLEDIDNTSRWHSIKNYQDQSQALTYLVQMDAIQFSPRKGLIHRK